MNSRKELVQKILCKVLMRSTRGCLELRLVEPDTTVSPLLPFRVTVGVLASLYVLPVVFVRKVLVRYVTDGTGFPIRVLFLVRHDGSSKTFWSSVSDYHRYMRFRFSEVNE